VNHAPNDTHSQAQNNTLTAVSVEGGPLLRLFTAGLRLWLGRQCDQLDSLELELQGSAESLLRGRLAGVRVRARGVRYQHLQLELVDLTSGPLRVAMGSLWRGQPVQLQEPFEIQGVVGFSAAGLNHSLAQPRWRPLANQLAEDLLGVTPLVGLRLDDNRLVLAAQGLGESAPLELPTRPEVERGGLALVSEDGRQRSLLPMDSSLRLQRASLEAGLLVLAGQATVTP
jgi:hypothetical protein